MTLKEPGSTLEVQPVGDSINAKSATVFPNNVIEIRDVWGTSSEVDNVVHKSPYKCDFLIVGSWNPTSAQDAGPLKIITYTQIDGKYYVVDEGETVDSFIPGPGDIRATAPVTVSNPITWNKDSTWTLKFTCTNTVPKGGFIKVMLPAQVTLTPATAISGGTCSKWTCETADVTSSQIIFQTTEDVKGGDDISIDIVGIQNPRTTQPTDTFKITTYFTDKVSVIDSGYDSNTAMSFLGELGSFSAT